jgi:hypothetical protein
MSFWNMNDPYDKLIVYFVAEILNIYKDLLASVRGSR